VFAALVFSHARSGDRLCRLIRKRYDTTGRIRPEHFFPQDRELVTGFGGFLKLQVLGVLEHLFFEPLYFFGQALLAQPANLF